MQKQFFMQNEDVYRCAESLLLCFLIFFLLLRALLCNTLTWSCWNGTWSRKEIERVKELFDGLAKIKEEYESIERPTLRVETPTRRPQSPLSDKNSSPSSSQFSETQKNKQEKISNKKDKVSDVTAELERLDSGSGRSSRDDNSDEIIEWEFDALDKDLHISGWPAMTAT